MEQGGTIPQFLGATLGVPKPHRVEQGAEQGGTSSLSCSTCCRSCSTFRGVKLYGRKTRKGPKGGQAPAWWARSTGDPVPLKKPEAVWPPAFCAFSLLPGADRRDCRFAFLCTLLKYERRSPERLSPCSAAGRTASGGRRPNFRGSCRCCLQGCGTSRSREWHGDQR